MEIGRADLAFVAQAAAIRGMDAGDAGGCMFSVAGAPGGGAGTFNVPIDVQTFNINPINYREPF